MNPIKILLTSFFSFCLSFSIFSQIEIYACYQFGINKITIDENNVCSEETVPSGFPPGGYSDIAFHPNGKLYSTNGEGLYYRDPNTNSQVFVGSFGTAVPDDHFLNALVSDAEGNLYGATVNDDRDKGYLYHISTSGQATYKGEFPSSYISAGDLFFYECRLYLTVLEWGPPVLTHLLEVNIENPQNSINVGTISMFTSLDGRGAAIYHENCENPRVFANQGNSQIVEYDMDNITPSFICQPGPDLRGMTIPGDYLASGCFTCEDLDIVTIKQDPICPRDSNGELIATAIGGKEPYEYLWSTGSNASQISNLKAGSYSVTVTDINGCTFSVTRELKDPPAILLNTSVTEPISCFGGQDGKALVAGSGGTGSLLFEWGNGQNGPNLCDVGVGSYAVTATDENGCTISSNIFINQPAQLVFGCHENEPTSQFGANDGSISLVINGGTEPYTVQYIGPSSGSQSNLNAGDLILTDLFGGDYALSLTDANGCSFSCDLFICTNINEELEVIICEGEEFEGYTETGVYQDVFNSINGCDSIRIIDLTVIPEDSTQTTTELICAGETYNGEVYPTPGEFTITEILMTSQGCEYTLIASLGVLAPAEIIDSTISADDGTGIGSITIDVGNSVSATFLWSNGATTQNISNLETGTYGVTVTEWNGCESYYTFFVGMVNSVFESERSQFEIYPNPLKTGNSLVVLFERINGSKKMEIFNSYGQVILSKKINSITNIIELPPFIPSGIYFVKIEGYRSKKLVVH